MKKENILSDDIGLIELVDHQGSDLTICNSARVSFGSRSEKIMTNKKEYVYIVIGGFNYEGENLRGVFNNLEAAVEYKRKEQEEWNWDYIDIRKCEILTTFPTEVLCIGQSYGLKI